MLHPDLILGWPIGFVKRTTSWIEPATRKFKLAEALGRVSPVLFLFLCSFAQIGSENVVKDSSLPAELPGSVSGHSFAIVVSRYHHAVTGKLLEGALATLAQHSVPDEQIHVAWAPGAWELPIVTQRLIRSGKYAGILCFGCVIRGETTHDQYINATVSQSLSDLSLSASIPIGFGLLTCNTMDQAVARSGGDVGNKGVETAKAVIETLKLIDSIDDIS